MPPIKKKPKIKKKFSTKVLNKNNCKGETYIQIDNEVYYTLFAYIINTLNDLKNLLRKKQDHSSTASKQSKESTSSKESYKRSSDFKFMEEIQDDLVKIKTCKSKDELQKVCSKLYLKYHPDKKSGNSNYFRIAKEQCDKQKIKLT
jgi:hypothetical protein